MEVIIEFKTTIRNGEIVTINGKKAKLTPTTNKPLSSLSDVALPHENAVQDKSLHSTKSFYQEEWHKLPVHRKRLKGGRKQRLELWLDKGLIAAFKQRCKAQELSMTETIELYLKVITNYKA